MFPWWTWSFLQNPCKACCLSRRIMSVSQWQGGVTVLCWTDGGMSIPCCPVPLGESLYFQLRQPVCLSLSVFPFLGVLLFLLVTITCLAELSCESAVQALFDFYISSPTNKLLVIKIRTNSQGVRMSCFLCLSDEVWEDYNYNYPNHWKKDVFCVRT